MNSMLILLLCVCMVSSFVQSKGGKLPPVIFVPGDGGNQLDAKLNKTEIVHYICQKTTSDYFNIWLNIELLVPFVIDCWTDNVKLVYNNVTRKTSNQPGVDIRVPGFGDSFTVEWLAPSKLSIGAYFKDIANALVGIGYVRNVNIRGAPFDFRKGPSELLEYFDDLKNLVEETYTKNGDEKVIFIAYSMGGPISSLFFRLQPQPWKDKYIKSLISLSGAFAGSLKTLKVFVTGDDLGVYVLNKRVLMESQITFPSSSWLLPNSKVWPKEDILVETPEKNYTANDLKEFFQYANHIDAQNESNFGKTSSKDINYMTGWEMRKDQLPYTNFNPPGVEIHCLHGYGVKTVEKLVYEKGNFPAYPDLIYGDGDGSVNKRSLESCILWSGKQSQKIYHKPFPNLEHSQILRDDKIYKYILQVVQQT